MEISLCLLLSLQSPFNYNSLDMSFDKIKSLEL